MSILFAIWQTTRNTHLHLSNTDTPGRIYLNEDSADKSLLAFIFYNDIY